ncbi:MAG: chemotaxis protein CheW [Deferribacterales bacterium]
MSYKDIEIPKSLMGVIGHMKSVDEYREELLRLGAQWDLLTILGQMVGTGTDMTSTRKGFSDLTNRLLCQLGMENVRKIIQEIGSKAQVAVDILIRNLFERTADIGFLATDDDIREFILKTEELSSPVPHNENEDGEIINRTKEKEMLKAALIERFQEYTAKYSVYFNIVLMDTDGNVLVQLDQKNKVTKSADPLIKESMETEGEYVEVYRYSDLQPNQKKSLIYAYRVTRENGNKDEVLGVLCLCFRFQNELEGIFKNLTTEGDWSVKLILDKEGVVIGSSDGYQVPIGSRMDMVLDKEYGLIKFAGKKYIAKTCPTKGYQGFFGLGWRGHVMIPIEQAFENDCDCDSKTQINEQLLHAVMSDPRLFSNELRSIPVQADKIQSDLERTVWNGNVKESDPASKVLLWSISDSGAKTKKIFEQSIGNLHKTVIDSMMSNVWFWAALAVDIMDRNLYERANDCRWWALTSRFKKILDSGSITSEDKETISDILAYINGLYTVYTNLFVYDANGRILAVSNPTEEHLVGTVLTKDFVRNTLALKESSQYSVSAFAPSELYGDRHTYIYGACITSFNNGHRVLGGIGIVFDSEPQFRAMLHDALPRNEKGEVDDGVFGVFTDRKGNVISSTDESIVTGSQMELDRDFFTMKNGEGTSRIVQYNGYYYAVGAHTSSGYREYKQGDGYSNDVIALIFTPLAKVSDNKTVAVRKRSNNMKVGKKNEAADCIEVATFFIGTKWLGVKADKIIEAINPDGLTTVPGSMPFVKGRRIYKDIPILVVDIRSILDLPEKEMDSETQIIVLRTGDNSMFGLIVDGLGEIPEICSSRVEQSDHVLDRSKYTECIVKPEPGHDDEEMLMVLRPDGIIGKLKEML